LTVPFDRLRLKPALRSISSATNRLKARGYRALFAVSNPRPYFLVQQLAGRASRNPADGR
jgi:hypothetical protein